MGVYTFSVTNDPNLETHILRLNANDKSFPKNNFTIITDLATFKFYSPSANTALPNNITT